MRKSGFIFSKYMPKRPPGQPRGDQRWSTFVANHAKAIVACDFLTVVTATFNFLYVFVIIEIETRNTFPPDYNRHVIESLEASE